MSGDKMADFYIPPQMKKRNNFILWKLETDDKGKQRKIPYSALYNGKASTTNGRTWTTYENALQCFKSGQYGGLGFVLDKDITFFDLDHCRDDNGVLTPLAENIIDNFKDTFIEVDELGENNGENNDYDYPNNFELIKSLNDISVAVGACLAAQEDESVIKIVMPSLFKAINTTKEIFLALFEN